MNVGPRYTSARYAWARQLIAFLVLLAVWEAAARAGMLNPLYLPSPSRIGAALMDLFSDGRIWPHLEATLAVSRLALLSACSSGSPQRLCQLSPNCSSR
jgi:NitT/TauT family transport system permease protein